jgi:3-hydroxyacyl-CoA dehydrogenase/enoyl-CoA hydratase/3-hydroxybutyryl-CoA epimerase
MKLDNFTWDQDAEGIVTLIWDMPGKPVNLLSMSAVADLGKVAEALASDAGIKGLVITSAKKGNFCAGADLEEMAAYAGRPSAENIKAAFDLMMNVHKTFRKLETSGKPVAAALNGTALGGGLETALACHYRVAADVPDAQFGFPEGQVGLIPGAGGTQRTPRLISAMGALPFMLESKRISPREAQGMGLIHKLVPENDLLAEAKAWVKANKSARQPWDNAEFRIPGGGPFSSSGAQVFTVGNAMLRQKTYDNYPAQRAIMSSVYEGLLVDIDTGLKIEARYFLQMLMNPVSRNMIRTLFLSMQELGKGARRPAKEAPVDVKRLGVLGAGLMGAGIAYVSAVAGIDVTLIDTTEERANGGKEHAAKLMDKQIQRGKATLQEKEEVLARIHPATDYAALKDADLIVEAVFEDRKVKADVIAKADAVLPDTAIFGSNTSALPITGLAETSSRPENFIGVHFFSPVERMMLVEIILGKNTSPRALAAAIDYTRKIRKTPIVVNDSRGFYTSRCFGTYTQEGLRMVAEGIAPPLIENAGRMAGMPMGPLEVLDSVGIDTALKITRAARKEVFKSETPDAVEELMAGVAEGASRPGAKAAKGFYDYDERSKATRLWPEFLARKSDWRTDADPDELIARLLVIQALEAARCVEEGVVTDPRDADVGAILGWGFAPYTGGPLSYIDTMGAKAFVALCERLAAAHGKRFEPNALLKDMAAKGDGFYRRFGAKAAA